jgi:hypothetical protein
MVAALAMIFGFFWGIGVLVSLDPEKVSSTTVASVAFGGSVAVAWTVLGLARWLTPESTWVDRFGRILGGAAIVMALLALIVFRI